MDIVQKPSNSEYYTPSSEPFRIYNKHKETDMARMGFETTIPVFEWVKAFHALDKAEPLVQWFSTFMRPRSGNFFLYKTRARYRTAARQLRNTALVYHIFIINKTEKVDLSVCLISDRCLVRISAGFVE
jgi:hypothetical protein